MKEMQLLRQIEEAYRRILGGNLVGIYVHGSIAFHCFRWEKSDIDFLVVTKDTPSQEEKEALIATLLELDDQSPPKGFEMSVVREEVCREFQYPTPFELHFSNAHKERCRAGLREYCQTMNGVDPDLAAHFTVVRKAGVALCGKEIGQVFGEVPREAYLDSIRGDIGDAVTGIEAAPVYFTLNLCRVLACVREGAVLSKEQGGEWGLANLPRRFRPVVERALDSYRGAGDFVAAREAERDFAAYMLRQISAG